MERRQFLDFLGKGLIIVPALPSVLAACGGRKPGSIDSSIFPSTADEVIVADGLEYSIFIKEGDYINDRMLFGTENDYIALLTSPDNPNEGIMWVNHEMVRPALATGYSDKVARHRNMVNTEMHLVGGSILRVKKSGGKWEFIKNDPINNRLTAVSKIPFEWPELIAGNRSAVGTLANCSGGVTPWGTVLTCEEDYDNFYGDVDFETGKRTRSKLMWEQFFPEHLPEHYGWVVEVNLQTGGAKKYVAMGRFSHECATVKEIADGRVAVYSGDDREGGNLFKFISDQPGTLYPGKLYVANMEDKRWELLDISRPELAEKFGDQTELLIRAREAALLVGGSPLDRPEDIEIDPVTGDVIISLTNNKSVGNYHGSILKLSEDGDYDAMTFRHDVFLTGGPETGFSCPDNLCFDAAGNLWFCSDISGSDRDKGEYKPFGNNGIFVFIRNGEDAGKLFQVASAPNEAEFTGLCFAPDRETLFVSVQHPGERSVDLENLTSHWPGGGTTVPRSAVVAITGDLIRELQAQALA